MQLIITLIAAGNTAFEFMPSSSQEQILDKFVREATARSSYLFEANQVEDIFTSVHFCQISLD